MNESVVRSSYIGSVKRSLERLVKLYENIERLEQDMTAQVIQMNVMI